VEGIVESLQLRKVMNEAEYILFGSIIILFTSNYGKLITHPARFSLMHSFILWNGI